ncbi:DNA cytosine methyltransferase [Chloroflexia bacterium SDU3-3]|nr:DNA cytosine methyltransferase [Chloroflexia bacterium SDU3-3]
MTTNRRRKLRAIDLFSGCGGLTLGLKLAGFQVIGAVEIDSLAAETYKANHAEVEVWNTDICCLKPEDVKKKLKIRSGQLDLLAGCPPCEGFSSMRTLNGSRKVVDDRNDLIFQFLRFVEAFMPKTIMLENVPELASDERMSRFLSRIRELGYLVDTSSVRVLNAADYGVPQRRRRMILIASRFGIIPFAVQEIKYITVRSVIGSLPKAGQSGDALHDLPERRSEKVIKIIQQIPKDGGSRSSLPLEDQLDCHKKCKGFNDVYGRMSWDSVAPTITGGCYNPSKGRFIHPEENRAITLREAALLQSFPINYIFSLRRGKQYAAEMIGNALPPEFIKRQAKEIVLHLYNK